jgi:hypothetical protein
MCQLPVVARCERRIEEQNAKPCGEIATTTRHFEGEDVPLCAAHAEDVDSACVWAGVILGIAEWTDEDPEDIAAMVGPPLRTRSEP